MIQLSPVLDETLFIPLYIQLYEYLKTEIQHGHIGVGTKLPSIRYLSDYLALSKTTIENAYQQLITEGYIESRPRKGLFVAEVEKGFPDSPPKLIIESSLIEKPEHYRYDFHYGSLDLDSFPMSTWRKISNDCLTLYEKELFSYGDKQGERELRVEIAKYLREARGVTCVPEQIVIGAGTQPLLNLICRLIPWQNPFIAVEDPGYDKAKIAFSDHGLTIDAVPLQEDGIDVSRLNQSQAKIVYVTPSHQFPFGAVMSINKRMKLLKWAETINGFIIEDDYDGEFRYQGKPIPSLQGLDAKGRVIYMGTFSKVLLPSIRLSYMVLPPLLLDRYQQILHNYNQSVSKIHQYTVLEFMKNGDWDRHIRKVRTAHKKKHAVLITALKDLMGEKVHLFGTDAGLHIVVHMKDKTEQQLLDTAKNAGVKVYPTSKYWSSDETIPIEAVLLGFGSMKVEEIYQGIERLNQAWFG